MRLQLAEHVRRVVTSKVARPTQLRCEPAQLHHIFCTIVQLHGMQLEVGRTDDVCNLSRRWSPLHGWSLVAAAWVVAGGCATRPHLVTTHAAAAIVHHPGIFSYGPSNVTVGIRSVLDCRSGGGRFCSIDPS